MIAAALLCLPAQVSGAPGVVQAVRVELSGPLDSVEFATARGVARLAHPLEAGESVSLVVPVPADDARAAAAARVRIEGPRDDGGLALGRARVADALPPHPALDELPPALRARALPVPEARGALGPAAWLVAVCGAAAALCLWRRARLALCVALLAAAGVVLLRRPATPGTVQVLEADAGDVWLLRSVGARALPLPAVERPWRAYGVPADTRLELRVAADGGAVLGGRATLVVEAPWVAPGARLHSGRNDFEPFELVHTRLGGVWQRRGAWPLGADLPPVDETAQQAPAGWLAAGLPMEGDVWLALRRDGSWLRLVR